MTPSLTQQQVETAIRGFLKTILPGLETCIGQANRVPEPTSDNYVIMWSTLRKRLGTTVVTWNESVGGNPSVQSNTEALRLDMQLDFHGADSTDNAQVFATTFRSEFACQFFANSCFTPNYCSDGQQMPFINGEQQYEDRWTLTATFDANITVTTPQQFADEVEITTTNVASLSADVIFVGSGDIQFGDVQFYGE
jgi:hypothetical protein